MSDYRHPRWMPDTDAARLFGKVIRPFAELALVGGFMWLLDAPWWLFAIVGVLSLHYLRLRFRDVREEWNG
jgi:hypothetical protein